jgi:hypothetical protein
MIPLVDFVGNDIVYSSLQGKEELHTEHKGSCSFVDLIFHPSAYLSPLVPGMEITLTK